MKYLSLTFASLLLICASLPGSTGNMAFPVDSDFDTEEIRELDQRTLVVTLKTPKENLRDELDSRAYFKQYKANIKQYNQTLKKAFKNGWNNFGKGVKFVKSDKLDQYKSDKYAILRSTIPGSLIEKSNQYWMFYVYKPEETDELKKLKVENDLSDVSYFINFPTVKRVTENDEMDQFIPLGFSPFEPKDPTAHYEVLNGGLGLGLGSEKEKGYAPNDIVLTVKMMKHHLKALKSKSFDDDMNGFLKKSMEKNCSQLKNKTLVINSGVETHFLGAQAIGGGDKGKMEDKFEEKKQSDDYQALPYQYKVWRAPRINKAVMNNKSGHYYIKWYPYTFNQAVRVVLSHEGKVMAIGKYASMTGKLENDLEHFSECN